MEWNWLSWNNMITPCFLSESTGDSEEVKPEVHEEDEAVMDEHEHEGDDDAQSCSYDHLIYYINNSTGNMRHDQSQRLISYDDDHGDIGEIDDDEDHEDKNKNEYCQSKQQWRSNCVHDPSNQRESDRKFWEACLAS